MTVRAKSVCRTVWLSCMCVCTCAFALVSHYPEIETNRAGSALRSKPPHRLPLTSQPSKGASVCGCGCFHLALYEVCVSLQIGLSMSWFVWYHRTLTCSFMWSRQSLRLTGQSYSGNCVDCQMHVLRLSMYVSFFACVGGCKWRQWTHWWLRMTCLCSQMHWMLFLSVRYCLSIFSRSVSQSLWVTCRPKTLRT